MKKYISLLAFALLLMSNLTQVQAQIFSPGGASGSITVKTTDSITNVPNVQTIQVTNGSLTNNGSGNVTIATNGASTVTIGSSVVTGGTPSSLLYVGAGPVLQQVSITGLVLGNGASAPSVYGGGTCTNQVFRVLAGTGAVTCATITSAFVDSTVAVTNASNTFTAGVRQTFAPNGTTPGLNFGSNAGDPSTPSNGDVWYNSSTNKFRCRENGSNFDCTGLSDPGSNGILSRTAANTVTNRTITGTANAIDVTNGDGVAGNPTFNLSPIIDANAKSVIIPHSVSLPGTCSVGQLYGADSATTGQRIYYCQTTNTWVLQGDGGGGGSIGGSTGGTDKSILIANGTGGSTLQNSGCTITAGLLACTGGISAGSSGTGTLTLLEGTPPGAGANAGEHNVYFDSGDSLLKSQKNGGTVQVYAKTNMNLSSFAATTSAQLIGVLSDETGSGAAVFGTSPTITTPTFSGVMTFPAGVRQIFAPNGTNAGINVGSNAGAVASPSNGDIWYDTVANKYSCRENGVTVNCIVTGAGSGTVTNVGAGTGIGVVNPTTTPTVSWSPSTQVNSFTIWDASQATRTMTLGVTGTAPVLTFSSGVMNLSTGAMQIAGAAVPTDSSTKNYTNLTMDVEGTGNVITLPRRYWYPMAGCNNATAGSIWDLPTTNAAVPACVTGTNIQKGVMQFADPSNLSAQITHKLPSTWTGAVDVNFKWYSSVTTGNVVWQVATICVGASSTDDPAFNTASTVTSAPAGTTLQLVDASITGITTTGCSAGQLMHIKVFRDSGNVSDTMAGVANLIGVEFVMREAI